MIFNCKIALIMILIMLMECRPLLAEHVSKDWEIDEDTIQQLIQVIGTGMSLYGITCSIGRLYGVLYFSDEPLTLDDMRDALEMSKTSMSTGVRTLSEMKMVEPTFR